MVLLLSHKCVAGFLNYTFNSATDVPLTTNGYSATGGLGFFALNFEPTPGTALTVIRNTSPAFIDGTFSNLSQGQGVTLSYGGISYYFIANYFGGTGNDLVLVWARSRAYTWGENSRGTLGIGEGGASQHHSPVSVSATGALLGKTILKISTGINHTLALCSDGTLAAWGQNDYGQLGDGTTTDRYTPVRITSSVFPRGARLVSVAAGENHSLALFSDGTAVAWGQNFDGQLGDNSTTQRNAPVRVDATGVLSTRKVTAIAAGGRHSLALCADGEIASWGANGTGQLGDSSLLQRNVPVIITARGALTGKQVTALSAGSNHSLALTLDGRVAAWGSNQDGQLGDGTNIDKNLPVSLSINGVLEGKTAASVSAGSKHNLALCTDGTVAAWGANTGGRLGDGTTTSRNRSVAVTAVGALNGKTVLNIAAGAYHSFASCSDGTLASWGGNTSGILGDGTTNDSHVPTMVNTATLPERNCFATSFESGKGRFSSAIVSTVPPPEAWTEKPVANPTSNTMDVFGTIIANGESTAASFEYGTTTSYGTSVAAAPPTLHSNESIRVTAHLTGLAPGRTYQFRAKAESLGGISYGGNQTFMVPAGVISANYQSAQDVALTTDSFDARGGTLVMELNFAPSVGTNLTVVNNTGLDFITGTFSNVAHGQTISLSFAGVTYTFVANYFGGTGNDLVLVWPDTRVFAWGANGYGQLGDQTTTMRKVPIPVTDAGVLKGKTVISVATGGHHSLALCSDGTVVAWGRNASGQLGDGSTTDRPEPVAVSRTSANSALFGKTVIAIAAGQAHSLALCSDGTVAAWGDNANGQLGNNTTVNQPLPVTVNKTAGVSPLYGKIVTAIAAGKYHNVAICSDGSVAASGLNSDGQLGDNSLVQRIVPVSVITTAVISALNGKLAAKVASGGNQNLVLCTDGSLVAWGDTLFSSGSRPALVEYSWGTTVEQNTVIDIAAGVYHSLALNADGTAMAWGTNTHGQIGYEMYLADPNNAWGAPIPLFASPNNALYMKTVTAVAAGEWHSMALCSDGSLAAWGRNDSGQVGNDGTTNQFIPVTVSRSKFATGERFVSLSKSGQGEHSLAIVAGPQVPWVKTMAATGIAGTQATLHGLTNAKERTATISFEYGTTTSYEMSVAGDPADVTGNVDTAVSATISGLNSGATYHYRVKGTNSHGSSAGMDHTFKVPPGPVTVTFASATNPAITTDGYDATGGTLGVSLAFAPSPGTNLTVVNNTTLDFIKGSFSDLAHGQTVVLNYGGTAYHFVADYFGGTGNDLVLVWKYNRSFAWGLNASGQLGDQSNVNRHLPTPVPSSEALNGKTVISVATGRFHSLALCSDATVVAWGSNGYGQIGNGTSSSHSGPVIVDTMSGVSALHGKTVVAIAAGDSHSLALCSDGTVAAWGANFAGQLGDGSTTNRLSPTLVDSTSAPLLGKVVVAISAGSYHNLALLSDGTVAAWGQNYEGQIGDNTSENIRTRPVVVSASQETSALYGKTVIAISAGGEHSLALCSDGTVASWGSGSFGQLGFGNPDAPTTQPVMVNTTQGTSSLYNKTVVAIAAGELHSIALTSDGRLSTWGYTPSSIPFENYVPKSVNTSSSSALFGKSVVAVTSGYSRSFAFCSDGTLTSWGSNLYGQLGDNSTANRSLPVKVNNSALAVGEKFTSSFRSGIGYHTLAVVTSPMPPAATTLEATAISATTVTLNGSINAHDGSATASFDLGQTTEYGSNLTASPSSVTGSNNALVSLNVTGLTPNTTYHFRAKGQSVSGSQVGEDYSFTTLVSPLQTWREFYFDTLSNTGNAADTATPQNDGVTNLMKFATGMDPTIPGKPPGVVLDSTGNGDSFTFTYPRSKAAVNAGIQFVVEWADTPNAIVWGTTGVTEAPPIDQGDTELITATIPKGTGSQRFVHLRVAAP